MPPQKHPNAPWIDVSYDMTALKVLYWLDVFIFYELYGS